MKVEYTLASKTLEGVIAEAKRAEALGYDGVSSGETSHDPFFRLVLAGEHTSRLTLCTSVLIAFPRSPMVVAYEAWDVQEFTKGRLLLGLGDADQGAHRAAVQRGVGLARPASAGVYRGPASYLGLLAERGLSSTSPAISISSA